VPSRLAWLALHVAIITVGTIALWRGWGGWWAAAPIALVIGHSFAGCAFVGHETMHGAVVRSRGWRTLIGWICFLPFTMSPRLWVAWHNKTHHGNTMSEERDPDAYPTLAVYRTSRAARFADFVSLGVRRWWGVLTLLVGFTGQSSQMLWRWSKTTDSLTPEERRLAVLETLAGFAFWIALAVAIGPLKFIFAFGIPLIVANVVVVSYILTNHSLSPLTDVNDPLVNSLTVTVPRFVERLHLNFGLHVEHHLFPSMSSAYAPLVRAELLARWPERYQSMSLWRALGRLARTPRIYGSPTRLHDPRTGIEAATLQPGVPAAREEREQGMMIPDCAPSASTC
jgi:fatty acid desaturase